MFVVYRLHDKKLTNHFLFLQKKCLTRKEKKSINCVYRKLRKTWHWRKTIKTPFMLQYRQSQQHFISINSSRVYKYYDYLIAISQPYGNVLRYFKLRNGVFNIWCIHDIVKFWYVLVWHLEYFQDTFIALSLSINFCL